MNKKIYSLFIAVLITANAFSQINLVKDINPGVSSGVSSSLQAEMNNVLYFVGNDGANGDELWRTDGTNAGTSMVKDINPGSSGSSIQVFCKIGNTLFFYADDGVHGYELWKSDGTSGGTVLVKDIEAGSAGSFYSNAIFGSVGNKLIFVVDSAGYSAGLWVSDGTSAGTQKLTTNISFDIYCYGLGTVGNHFYFTGLDVTNSSQLSLYTTDGTSAGTSLIANGGWVHGFNAIGNNAVFGLDNGNNDREPWISDGTFSGTHIIKDICPGTSASLDQANIFYLFNSKLYFAADDGVTGNELWVTDGTSAGTTMVKDIYPGVNASIHNGFSYQLFAGVLNGKLYFQADDGTSGSELWVTDGTSGGTALLKDISSGSNNSTPEAFFSTGNYLYFTADDGTDGYELFRTDGTSGGTILLKDIYAGANSSSPGNFINTSNGVYFTADDGVNGNEVWLTDGSPTGTNLVEDLYTGSTGSNASAFILVNNYLVFQAATAAEGYELFNISGVGLGIEENSTLGQANLKVYPNPSNGLFMVQLPLNNNELSIVDVYNTIGEKVYSANSAGQKQITINLSDEPSGVYMLQVKTKTGILNKKLIKVN